MEDNELLRTAGELLERWKATRRSEIKHNDDDADEFQRWLNEPVNRVEHPMDGHSKNNNAHITGWKAGYWSDPAIKAGFGLKAFDSLTVPALTGGFVGILDRPMSLLDVIPTTPLTGTDLFAFLRETVRTHGATEVAVSALKPTSTYTLVKVEDSARTIATLSEPIPLQHLRDTRLLAEYLDGSLRQSVMLRLEGQVLNGNGVDPNLEGMRTVAGTQSQAFSTNMLESLRKGLTLLQNVHIPAGIYVLGSDSWESIELLQETDGTYLAHNGGPVDLAARRIWGQRVVTSTLLNGTNAAVLFDPGSVQLYERDGLEITTSPAPEGSVAGSTAFESNEVLFRAEGRWGFAVLRPAGIIEIALV